MENKELFKNAKFGDKFKTRGNDVAIYQRSVDGMHYLFSEHKFTPIIVNQYGRKTSLEFSYFDIVSRWEEKD